MAREGGLAREVWNEGLTRHDTGTRYILAGRMGANVDGAGHVNQMRRMPTLFEHWRRQTGRPLEDAFAAGIPETSDHKNSGPDKGAATFLSEHTPLPGRSISADPSLGPCPHVSVTNQLLGRIVSSLDESGLPVAGPNRRRLMRVEVEKNFPAPLRSGELGQLAVDAMTDRLMNDRPYVLATEADDWLLELSRRAIGVLTPTVIGLGFSTPDLAHRGAWQTYAAQVRRVDVLLGELIRTTEEIPFYRGQTLYLVTTDCGRDSVRFDRHGAIGADDPSRETFLVAWGRGAAAGAVVSERRRQVDVAPTAARALDFEIPAVEGSPIEGVLA